MKKITSILSLFFLLAASLSAQSEIDALRFSRGEPFGTARFMSMGGAFGALGGDMTAIAVNPAGIAVYRTSEVSGTLHFMNESSVSKNHLSDRNRFELDQIGFVGYFPMRNEIMPLVNFGFSVNRHKSFNKTIYTTGSPANSLMDYMALRSEGINPDNLKMGENLPDPFETEPWLSVLGFNSYLINPIENTNSYRPLDIKGASIDNKIHTRESGHVDSYDFTLGTTLNNVLNLGIALSVKDLSYNLTSDYEELFNLSDGRFTLSNWLNTSGAGFSAKLGAIYRPLQALRIGVTYHTPTWFAINETYEAMLDDDMKSFVDDPNYKPDKTYSARFPNKYEFKTPGKFVGSIAAVLGNRFIASMDYELSDYRRMQLMVPSGSGDNKSWYYEDNQIIRQDFTVTSTIHAGMEYRFTPRFSGRLGYIWMENPYDDDVTKFGDMVVSGSNTIFRIEGDTHYLTGGFGYRFNRSFFMDLAVVYRTQTDQLFPFPNYYKNSEKIVNASGFTLDNNSIRAMLTLGYKF